MSLSSCRAVLLALPVPRFVFLLPFLGRPVHRRRIRSRPFLLFRTRARADVSAASPPPTDRHRASIASRVRIVCARERARRV